MAVTIERIETVLGRRIGNYLAAAGMSAESSPNPYLSDPIAWALRMLGYPTEELDAATDDDLTSLAVAHQDALLDLAELRALESCLTQYSRVSGSVGPVSEQWGELGNRLATLVKTKRDNVAAQHGSLLTQPLTPTDKRPVQVQAL